MNKKFSELEKVLRQTADERQNYKKALVMLNSQKDTYSSDYIERKALTLHQNLKATNQTAYEKVMALISDLVELAIEKHSKLNLDNPAWTSALKLIELSGPNIDYVTVKKINESFKGDLSAWSALRDIYKARGIINDGSLTDQIYEPKAAFDKLREYAYYSFIQEGSLNELSNAVSKIARMEGIEFPQMVDDAGSIDVMRLAAGLPPK